MANLKTHLQFRPESVFNPKASVSTPFPFWKAQLASLHFMGGERFTLLYSEPSTGKTRTILSDAEYQPGLRLIVCPAKPISVYDDDYKLFWQGEKPFELYPLDKTKGTIKDKGQIIETLFKRKANAVIALTYEAASKLPLSRWNFSTVYFDEGHRVGAYRSKQSIHFARECVNVPRKVVASGTSFHDGYERLYGIYRLFDPYIPTNRSAYPTAELFGTYDQFLNDFTETWSRGFVRIIKKYKNIDLLAELIRPSCLHIKTTDIKELAKIVQRVYTVELAPETKNAYDSLIGDAIIDFGDSAVLAPLVLTRVLRGQQLIASGELKDDAGTVRRFNIDSRLDMLASILDDLGSEPVVIFTRFDRDVELISTLCKRSFGETPKRLTGSHDEHEAWKAGDGRILIANTAAGSEGVRLARARHAIFWSVDYSLKKFVQSHARIRRTDQVSDTVFYHYLQSNGTVDQDIYAALNRKTNDVSMLDEAIRGE